MSDTERNVFTFSVMSLLTQLFITTMVVMAQSGQGLQDPTVAQNLITQQTGDIQDATTQVSISEDDVTDIRGDTSIGAVFDPILFMLNIGKFLGMAIQVMGNFGLTYLTLWAYTAQMSYFGWIIASCLGIWQVATIYYILTFMFPGRFK